MSMTVKTNVKLVIEQLREGNFNIIQAAKVGLFQGMRFFESHIIKTQMTGRKSKFYGLKAPTGTLRRSWFTYIKKVYNDFTVATATDTKYAIAHQRPSGYTGTPYIPKRLYIYETFEGQGMDFINKGMVKSLSRFVRLR